MSHAISSLTNSFILASLTVLAGCATSDGLNLKSCQTTHDRKVFDIKNTNIPAGDNNTITVNIDQPFQFTSTSAVNSACEEAKMTAALALTESTPEKLNPRSAAAAQLAISKYTQLSGSPDTRTADFNAQVLGFLPIFLGLGGFDLEMVSLAANQYEKDKIRPKAEQPTPKARTCAGTEILRSCSDRNPQ